MEWPKKNSRDKLPFKLATTSFIVPDHILPNVRMLGPFFDEIELLVFESLPKEVIPSMSDVNQLLAASREFNLTYNIHLPTDISLCSNSSQKRVEAAGIYQKALERFAPLCPTTHTLHLEMPEGLKTEIRQNPGALESDGVKRWQEDTTKGLDALLSGGVNPAQISIETLDYPFSLAEPFVRAFDLPVCLDLGHGIKYGYDEPVDLFEAHGSRIPLMHLHGVAVLKEKVKDHTRLDALSPKHLDLIIHILKRYTGTVSLEVFNLENLNHSLACLSRYFTDIPKPIKPERRTP